MKSSISTIENMYDRLQGLFEFYENLLINSSYKLENASLCDPQTYEPIESYCKRMEREFIDLCEVGLVEGVNRTQCSDIDKMEICYNNSLNETLEKETFCQIIKVMDNHLIMPLR